MVEKDFITKVMCKLIYICKRTQSMQHHLQDLLDELTVRTGLAMPVTDTSLTS